MYNSEEFDTKIHRRLTHVTVLRNILTFTLQLEVRLRVTSPTIPQICQPDMLPLHTHLQDPSPVLMAKYGTIFYIVRSFLFGSLS
jgi:hypothetical protein